MTYKLISVIYFMNNNISKQEIWERTIKKKKQDSALV